MLNKGAMRELRRDSAFISKQKWFETKEQDAERNKKVKTLMGQLAEQQAEKNKIEREKKKLKSKI
jgi:nucleolar protein 14